VSFQLNRNKKNIYVNFLVHIIGEHADNVNILDRSLHTIKKNTEALVVVRIGDRIQVGRDFPHPSRPALGPTHPPYNGYRVFLGGKGDRNVTLTIHPI
jgi:hypothetical protein